MAKLLEKQGFRQLLLVFFSIFQMKEFNSLGEMESRAIMTEETGITLQQEDETIEEIDCLWLMWDNLDWQENLRSPSTPKRRAQNIPRFPPIDCRPLVARNQFVSQSRLENMVGIMKQNSPSSSFVQKSNCLVEETIHEISSAIHGKTIDEILPSPREADFVDLLEDRRPSYGTALKSFAMMEKEKEKEISGYSSSEFWRSFLGVHHTSMIVKVDEIQK